MTYIYVLSHPETGEIRYVGLTRYPSRRLRQYRYRGHTNHLNNWLRSLPGDPTLRVIARVTEENGSEAERFWIACFRLAGKRLINYTDGGESGFRVSDETRRKLSEAARKRPGRKASPETRKKMSLVRLGHPAAPGARERFIALNKSRAGIPASESAKTNQRLIWTPERRAYFSEMAKNQGLGTHIRSDH